MFSISEVGKKMKKIKIGNLFYKNKFVAIFSIISSFIIWIVVSSNSTENIPITISDIPVDITLSDSATQDGLKIFSGQDITARVEVKGNRMIVGQLTKNDIQVSAPQAANTIMSPGNYTLELSAKKIGLLKDYTIASDVKPSVITVMVDRYREAEFPIESQIDFVARPGYFVGNKVLSTSSVILSGPETEISKIKKVVVKGDIPGEVSEPLTLKLPIIMYDAYGQAITNETIKSTFYEVEVNIPVLMKKEILIKPNFFNLPKGIDLSGEYKELIKVNPSKLEMAGPENVVSGIKNLDLEPIEFTSINMKNSKFTLPISLPQGCRSLNNVYSAEMEVNMSLFKERNIAVNRFSFLNFPPDKRVKVYNGSINVNLIGSAKSIINLKSSDIIAQIDFEGKDDNLSSMEMPVKLTIEGFNDVWTSGKYFVNVSLVDLNE